MPQMSNKEFIHQSFIKSPVHETLGRNFLFRFSNIFYIASLHQDTCFLDYLKNSLLIRLDNIF